MNNDTVGINTLEMKDLSKQMLQYHDNIKALLNEYSDVVSKTKLFFNGEVGNLYRKKVNEFEPNFKIVENTFLNYSNDFVNIINKYSNL